MEEVSNLSIGQIVRRVRDIRGWSVDELASRAKLRPSTLRRIECGVTKSPHRDTINSIETSVSLPSGTIITLASEKPDSKLLGETLLAASDSSKTKLAFGHSLFGAPLIWSLAYNRSAASGIDFASYMSSEKGGPLRPEFSSPRPSTRKADGTWDQNLIKAPRLDLHGGRARDVSGIERLNLDVTDIDPLFGPSIRHLWENSQIDVAVTMREALAEFCDYPADNRNSASHCASISHGGRGCQLVALISPQRSGAVDVGRSSAGHYAEAYLNEYLFKLTDQEELTLPSRRALSVDFLVKKTFEPRWDSRGELKEGSKNPRSPRDHFCNISDSNAEKQMKDVPWLRHRKIEYHSLALATFGKLWNTIENILAPHQGEGADLLYIVLWEPLTTWVRHKWAERAQALSPHLNRERVAKSCRWPAEDDSEDCEYPWSVEAPLDVIAGLCHGSPPLGQIYMDLYVRNIGIRGNKGDKKSLRHIHEFVMDLEQVIKLYRKDTFHADFQGQTAAYLSMPRGRCVRALREVQFELAFDPAWFELFRPSIL